jgi:DNA-directed RNA polymerase specialized sigma subunit
MVSASSRGPAWPDPATPEELDGIGLGSNEAATGLLRRWEPLIVASAKRRTACPACRDEAVQAGRLAVLDAAKRFDQSRGIPFNHYAARAVRNETSKAVQRLSATRTRERAIGGRPVILPGPTVEQRWLIRDWLNDLPRILQKVFVAIYRRRLSQREAALRLGVSQPRISQLRQLLLDRGREDLTGLERVLMN